MGLRITLSRFTVSRLALAVLLALSGCAADEGVTATVGAIRQAIKDGRVDATPAVLLAGHQDEQCSGFLVADDVVLTAAHCASATVPKSGCGPYPSAFKSPKELIVYAANDVDDPNGQYLDVAKVVPIDDASDLCGNDIVAIVLAKPAGIAPLEPRLDAPPIEGEGVSLIGFGNLTPADAGSAGVRRRRDDGKISHVGAREAAPTYGALTDLDFAVDVGPCRGDSGSPALDTRGRVLGVMSRGNAALCEQMAYTRLDVHRDWLLAVVAAAAQARGASPPAWAQPPEPGPDAAAPAPVADPPSGAGTRDDHGGCAVTTAGAPRDVASVAATALCVLIVASLARSRRARA